MNWTALDEHGIVVMSGSAPHIDKDTVFPQASKIIIGGPDGIVPERFYHDGSDFLPIPEKPGDEYVLDRASKQWCIDDELASLQAKVKRDRLLAVSIDTMNPMRWETLTDTQKREWRSYRQDLLDVPQQSGFPRTITWPEVPA